MSFILDALKKSEAERQRQDAPGIASIPETARQQSGSKWLWIIGALLAVNLIVVGTLVMRGAMDSPDAERPPQRATASEPPTSNPAVVDAPVARMAPTNSDLPSAPVATPAQEPRVAEQEPAIETMTMSESAAPAAEPQRVTAGLPSFNELRAEGLLNLPDMHLDIHVYSGQPGERFVFVNMSKYTEGATLSEGPAVKEITPDGVVLEYLGTDFLLPRE